MGLILFQLYNLSNILKATLSGQKYGNDGPRQHGNAAVCQSCVKQLLEHALIIMLAFFKLF